ncbi:MAG: winged helix DNA-binding domain-containing protein, partial [Chloroflexi bacterium]|nr:winged helix DNA-binding domain-containing protein [Chloroflexota bacterium]
PDPHPSQQAYWDWHVLRRIGGLGLAQARAGEGWLGILEMKAPGRQAALERLVDRMELLPVAVEGLAGVFYLRFADQAALNAAMEAEAGEALPVAAFLAPLDNLLWDRNLLRRVFDFDYIWEVYKPAHRRQYGYYVLPVLYGDRFVARLDPAFNRKAGVLTLQNWWWEAGVQPDQTMLAAVRTSLAAFAAYLGAVEVVTGPALGGREAEFLRQALPAVEVVTGPALWRQHDIR